jgi:hypothetical protein
VVGGGERTVLCCWPSLLGSGGCTVLCGHSRIILTVGDS